MPQMQPRLQATSNTHPGLLYQSISPAKRSLKRLSLQNHDTAHRILQAISPRVS
jgi:hypothetical protein